MHRGTLPENDTVEAAAGEWRSKAVRVFSWAGAVAYLPPITFMVTGQSPPNGWPAHVLVVGAYLSFLFCALFPRIDYRSRGAILVGAGYLVALVHVVCVPQGPLGRALLGTVPIMAVVFLGTRAGLASTLVSMVFLLIGPLLPRVPRLVELLTLEPAAKPVSLIVVLDQGLVLIAVLIGQMILLIRFHEFLLRSLAHQQREAAERAEACNSLAREMRERRRLENEVARAADEERRRLGLDIHDGVCQQLTGALLRCEALVQQLERGETVSCDALSALTDLLVEAIDEAHAVAKGLCPLEPHPEALATGLRTLVKRLRGAVERSSLHGN